ncbi:hypothetical protein COCON_G00055160 [Conger conger]|uniref:G-protein coupled receptors family 1 profile domain-containing protein n=1 Tax=Conger conger TaxID=82655 RepID=A0A9Q1DWD3_CONCO|nr:G-protein coupled receptor 39 [Conger conger]KAJ8282997.1 hypothetical protein COCON_G00055160 [Conger conger]
MDPEYEIAQEMRAEDWRDLEQPLPVKILLTVLYSLILLTGIVGNGVTIRVTQVLQSKGYLQKNVTDHMVSLACSDLLVLLIGLPVELYSAVWFPFSPSSGNLACKVYNFLFEACSYATILNVATLSFERYVAICHPFRYKSLSGSRTVKLIVFVWITSAAVALPLLFATGTEGPGSHNLTFCTNLSSRWVMYRSSIFGAFILYVLVLVSVGIMVKNMIAVLQGPKEPSAKKEVFLPKHQSSKAMASRKQTILFLGLIVGTLAVCWIPNQIRRLMTAALPKTSWTTPYFKAYLYLHPVADTFFYLSSVLNPFLYNLSSRQFRQVFLQVLRCHLTIEHVNRRTLAGKAAAANSTRSARPLVLRSFRRARATSEEEKPVSLTTFQSPGAAASCPLNSDDSSNPDRSATQRHNVDESEI